jgi:hypothetical protein
MHNIAVLTGVKVAVWGFHPLHPLYSTQLKIAIFNQIWVGDMD